MNRKILFLLTILFSAMSMAQSIPPQLSGLLSDSNDYACTGVTPCATWPSPAMPTWGASYTDPTWLTTIKKPSDPTNCSSGTCTSAMGIYPDYAKVPAWNIDGTLMLLKDDGAWYHLYDGNAYTEITRIQPGGANVSLGLAADDDVRWANSTNVSDAAHTIFYSTQSSLNSAYPCAMYMYNTSTQVNTLVHDFSSVSDGQGHTCGRLSNGDEGNQSNDDRWWPSFFMYNPSGWTAFAAIVYDRQTDTYVSKTLSANGLCGTTACPSGPDHIMMSPTGTYLVISWVNFGNVENGTHVRGTGQEVFDRNLNYLGQSFVNGQHTDVGYDVNGNEVVCGMAQDEADADWKRALYCRNLATVTTAPINGLTGPNPYVKILLPCTWGNLPGGTNGSGGCTGTWDGNLSTNAFETGGHISMRNSQTLGGLGQGWLLQSDYEVPITSSGNIQGYGWGASEIFAARVDMTQPLSATWRRISRTMSIRDANYNAEPHASPNRDLTKVVWGSDWLVDGGVVAPYIVEMAAPTLTGITITPSTASIVVGGTQQFSCTQTFSGGSTTNCTTTATWSSSSASVASVGAATGLATGVGSLGGTSTIQASYGGFTSTATMIVMRGISTYFTGGPPMTGLKIR